MEKPKSKPVEGEIQPPDFDKAFSIFTSDIRPANKAQKQAMQEASAGWKEIKGNRVHVGGFRLAMKIADMEEADQQMFLRSLNAGLKLRSISLHADLVDAAQGADTSNVIPIEAGRADARSDLEVPEGGDDQDEFEAAAPAMAAAE